MSATLATLFLLAVDLFWGWLLSTKVNRAPWAITYLAFSGERAVIQQRACNAALLRLWRAVDP